MERPLNSENNFFLPPYCRHILNATSIIKIAKRKESTLFCNQLFVGVCKNRKLILYLKGTDSIHEDIETKKDILGVIWNGHVGRYFANFVY